MNSDVRVEPVLPVLSVRAQESEHSLNIRLESNLGALCLGQPDPVLRVQDLPVQVRQLDRVVVEDGDLACMPGVLSCTARLGYEGAQPTDTSRREVEQHRTTESSRANDQDSRPLQLQLAYRGQENALSARSTPWTSGERRRTWQPHLRDEHLPPVPLVLAQAQRPLLPVSFSCIATLGLVVSRRGGRGGLLGQRVGSSEGGELLLELGDPRASFGEFT